MKIAVHSKRFDKANLKFFENFFRLAAGRDITLFYSDNVRGLGIGTGTVDSKIFSNYSELMELQPDYLISIGGDGTFLETLLYVRDSGIPILGINLGRLGFLSNNSEDELEQLFKNLHEGDYKVEERSIIQLDTNKGIFGENNIALNDFTIHKRDNSSLTTITTYLDGEFFNTYWGDGIIVSTPTGSTAYSLSCGGPIVFPSSKNLIVTPVAPHNLNVRPVIVPDDIEISFEIKGREEHYLVSLDSRYEIVDQSFMLRVKKAPFILKTITFPNQGFSKIITEKLMWGMDKRNF